MGRRWWIGSLAGLVLATALAMCGIAAVQAAEDPDRGAAGELLVLVNRDRAAAGLLPLTTSTVATDVAELWSQHMADVGDLAHNDGWFTTETRQRAGAGAVGENVATNVDLADAHRRLMNSPGHRANILDPRFHQVGIGVVRGTSGAWWITQDFLQVKNVPPVAVQEPPAPPPPPATTPPPPPPPAGSSPTLETARPIAANVPVAITTPPVPAPPATPTPAAPAADATSAGTPMGDEQPRELAAGSLRPPATPSIAAASRWPTFAVCLAIVLLAVNVQRLRRLRVH